MASPDEDERLHGLLAEARRRLGAEAGTVYVREGRRLRFAAVQNDALARSDDAPLLTRVVAADGLSLAERSVASYVALTRATVNVPDAYTIPPDRPYAFNRTVDARSGFRTSSILAVPLRDEHDRVVGVLQLLNALDETGRTTAFDAGAPERLADLLPALARGCARTRGEGVPG